METAVWCVLQDNGQGSGERPRYHILPAGVDSTQAQNEPATCLLVNRDVDGWRPQFTFFQITMGEIPQ